LEVTGAATAATVLSSLIVIVFLLYKIWFLPNHFRKKESVLDPSTESQIHTLTKILPRGFWSPYQDFTKKSINVPPPNATLEESTKQEHSTKLQHLQLF